MLGIDVGYSQRRRSSAACVLCWNADEVEWSMARFRAIEPERTESIRRLTTGTSLLAAAFDGPIGAGLETIGSYRMAERMLTRRLGKKIGKPGQSNSPFGRLLNQAASDYAHIVVKECEVAPATHAAAIHEKALVEAFPSAFMGMMIAEPETLDVARNNRSDRYFERLRDDGSFVNLSETLLPGRKVRPSLSGITDHDERAAFVCALTALGVATGQTVSVGDEQGWIFLPPPSLVQGWAMADLHSNAAEYSSDALRVTAGQA